MRRTNLLLVVLALTLLATNAAAQGFGIYEQSACALGRGGATVAAPCNDGSAIFFNPAGIAMAPGPVVSFGASLINPHGHFTSDTGTTAYMLVRYYQVPNAYVVVPMGRAAFGVGLFAPYGLTTEWPLNFEGRFLGYRTQVKGIYVQPTAAYKLSDKVAIGGGLDITYASLELNQRVDLSSQQLAPGLTFAQIGVPAGTDFANVKLAGHKYHVGFNLGVHAQASPKVSVGARYLSRQRFEIDGGEFTADQLQTNLLLPVPLGPTLPKGTPIDRIVSGQFSGTGALAPQSAQTSIVFPDQFVAGIAVKAGPQTTIMGDYIFTHWKLFDQIVISRANVSAPTVLTENYRNTHGVRVGVEHELNANVALRAGFIAHTAAAPDETVTPLLPEGKRQEISGGVGFRVVKNLRADAYYLYLHQPDRRGRTTTGSNNGVYTYKGNLFGLTFVLGL